MKSMKYQGLLIKKRVVFIVAMCCIITALSGCGSGITQTEYDALESENDDLKADYEKLNDDYEKMKENYSAELANKSLNVVEELPLQYAEAWAITSFGNNVDCAASDKYLHVIVNSDTTLSTKSVNDVMNKFVVSVQLYKAAYDMNPSGFSYDTVSVTFLDINKTEFLNISFKKSANEFILNKILVDVDITNLETIINGINEATKK